MHDDVTGTKPAADRHTIRGEVQFFWDSGDDERHLLVNIEPENPHAPDAWDLYDDQRDAVIGEIVDGATIEISYVLDHHEVVDPESGTTHDGTRARIESVRIV